MLPLSRSSSNGQGYGSRSHNENVPVSAMDWKHVTSDAGLFLDVCRVVCAKAVGATSSEGFLFVSFLSLQ